MDVVHSCAKGQKNARGVRCWGFAAGLTQYYFDQAMMGFALASVAVAFALVIVLVMVVVPVLF